MYLVTAKTKATAQDFPGSTVEWAVGQTREVHDSLIQEFKNNPAAWTVSGGATTSTVTATSSAQGVRKPMVGSTADEAAPECGCFVDFSGRDALPTKTNSGHALGAYLPSGAVAAQSVEGITLASGAAGYFESRLSAPVNAMYATVEFDDAAGALTTIGAIALVVWGSGGVVQNGLGRRARVHVTYNSNGGLLVDVRETVNGTLTNVINRATPAPAKNKPITMCVVIDGTTLHVVVDSVYHGPFTDSRFAALDEDLFACWEIYKPTPASAVDVLLTSAGASASDGSTFLEHTLSGRLHSAIALTKRPTFSAVQLTLAGAQTITTAWAEIPGTTVAATPINGRVMWDIEIPVAQTSGDGAASAGSIWVGVAAPGTVGDPVFEHTARAGWEQTNGVLRRRIITTGHQNGAEMSRAVFVKKDAGGAGASTVVASRAIVHSATAY